MTISLGGGVQMIDTATDVELISTVQTLLAKERILEAEVLVVLGEIDARKLYVPRGHSSMFTFCVDELGFSEDAACNRIAVARAARRLPAILETARTGVVHLTGLRVLAPHLTEENCAAVLAQAAGKSKRLIEELVARLAPRPSVATVIRKLPVVTAPSHAESREPVEPAAAGPVQHAPAAQRDARTREIIAPLSGETFRVHFTASRGLRDKLRKAQDLLGHTDADLAAVVERAVDLLIAAVEKNRFAVVRKPRKTAEADAAAAPKADAAAAPEATAPSRSIPAAIRRKVYMRDGGRCTYTDARGHRCRETSRLEFDHIDGFARTREHDASRIRLLCRAHNQHAADELYGRSFMDHHRARAAPTLPMA